MNSHEQPLQQAAEDRSDEAVPGDTGIVGAPEGEAIPEVVRRPRILWVVPGVLGLFIVFVVVILPVNDRFRWAFSLANWETGLNYLLASSSAFIGVFLILYAIVLWRFDVTTGESERTSQYAKAVVVPLVLWLLAISAVGFSLLRTSGRLTPSVPAKPCAELYLDAVNISKDRPNFRMLPSDPDELRCGINNVVFG